MKARICLLMLFFCAARHSVDGDMVELTPIKDTTIISTGNSNGAGESLFNGRTGIMSIPNGIRLRAVMAFDVAGNIPAGSSITSASLTLNLNFVSIQGGSEVHTLHRVLTDWGEGTSSALGGMGAAPTTNDATWFHTFFPDEFWINEGGDFRATASSSQTIMPQPGAYTFSSTAETVADVQLWLDDPASNFGWLLMGNEDEMHTARKFDSRESGLVDQRPTLTVEFDPLGACPADCADPNNGEVEITDLLALLAQWGGAGTCDFDGGGVDIEDLLALLADWGPCSP